MQAVDSLLWSNMTQSCLCHWHPTYTWITSYHQQLSQTRRTNKQSTLYLDSIHSYCMGLHVHETWNTWTFRTKFMARCKIKQIRQPLPPTLLPQMQKMQGKNIIATFENSKTQHGQFINMNCSLCALLDKTIPVHIKPLQQMGNCAGFCKHTGLQIVVALLNTISYHMQQILPRLKTP